MTLNNISKPAGRKNIPTIKQIVAILFLFKFTI